jgi:hypothetical protein
MRFTPRHFFGPQGELHSFGESKLHVDYILDNPQLFGFKNAEDVHSHPDVELYKRAMGKGFIRGEYSSYDNEDEGYTHNHMLSHEAPNTKPWNFTKAVKTLHDHYSKNPNSKFKVSLYAYNMKDDDALHEYVKDVTGGGSYLTSLDHLAKVAGIKSDTPEKPVRPVRPVRPVKKISRRGTKSEVDTSQLAREPRMGQGSMTKAEWNFWRRKGLGDSYNPLMSFKRYITENL